MGDVVNLRTIRKRRDRQAKEASAAENRGLHGRSGAQKRLERAERDSLTRHVDRHRIEPAKTTDDTGMPDRD